MNHTLSFPCCFLSVHLKTLDKLNKMFIGMLPTDLNGAMQVMSYRIIKKYVIIKNTSFASVENVMST